MRIISEYTAQNVFHLQYNFSLLMQCALQNIKRGSCLRCLNGSYGPDNHYFLIRWHISTDIYFRHLVTQMEMSKFHTPLCLQNNSSSARFDI